MVNSDDRPTWPRSPWCLHKLAKPQAPQTTCSALPQPPVQVPPPLLHTSKAAFDLSLPRVMPRAGHHTLAGLCALWLPGAASSSGNLHKPANPQPPQTTSPALPQPQVQDPPHLLSITESAFDLVLTHDMPRAGRSHTGRALCAVEAECCHLLWKSPQTSSKTAPPTTKPPA